MPARATRLAVAAHILALLEIDKEAHLTSDYIAASVNTNASFIRRVIGMLSRAGLVEGVMGIGGTRLLRAPESITLLDIHAAVGGEDGGVFAMHEHPNPACPVGGNIKHVLDAVFTDAEQAIKGVLARVTVADLVESIREKAAS